MEDSMASLRNKLEYEDKEKLERAYGVMIHPDALTLTCIIVTKYFDDKGKSSDSREVLLHGKGTDLLQKACSILRSQLDAGEDDEEEKRFDANHYVLRRALVERKEISKEKDPARNLWLSLVEWELNDSTAFWHGVLQKQKPLLELQISERRDEEIQLLQRIRLELLSCLPKEGGVDHVMCTTTWLAIVDRLDASINLLSKGALHGFDEAVTVGFDLIAKVAATSLVHVPASWLIRSLNPPSQSLQLPRWNNGEERAIRAISHALSRRKLKASAPSPLGSFLLLGGSVSGGLELAEVIAQELFDSKDSLVHIDLLEYIEPCSSSRLLGVSPSQGKLALMVRLTEAVNRRQCSVLLLNNIDVADASIIDILIEILSHGRLIDGQGSSLDFTNTLIIMISKIGVGKYHQWGCKCSQMVGKCLIKELLDCHPEQNKNACNVLFRLKKVQSQFNSQLFELVDDVVILDVFTLKHCKAIARLEIRDIASSLSQNGLIIYPSEAALDCILFSATWTKGVHRVKIWLEENLVPELRRMCTDGEIGDDHIIYIDALAGMRELSYRLEDCDDSLEEPVWSKFQDSPAELRALCKKEKERIKKIFSLRRKYYELITTLRADAGLDYLCAATKIQELISITDLMINAIGATLISGEKRGVNEAEIKSSDVMMSKLRLGDRADRRAKPRLDCLKGRLRSRSSEQAIDVIGGAILRIIDGTQNMLYRPVVSFLFLGLKPFARAELEKDLIEHFVTDDGVSLLIEIDLSQYADSDSLPRLMDTLLRCTSREQSGVQFPEAVRMRPCSILFLHQVEKAHISVFSALISVLDDGIFIDKRGRTADFTDTVVIITSDVGNKEIFASLVDHAFENVEWDGDSEQEARKGFRSELLNRVDEMVFFNPFARDQLRRVARLSMRSGSHLEGSSFSAFPTILFYLFKPADDPVFSVVPSVMRMAVNHLSKGLIDHRSVGSAAGSNELPSEHGFVPVA